MEDKKRLSHFRDGLLFKIEIVEVPNNTIVLTSSNHIERKDSSAVSNTNRVYFLRCECEDKKSKDLWNLDIKQEEVRMKTDYLIDRLDSLLKFMEVGLLGNSYEVTLVIVRNEDEVVLSFSYRTELVSRDFVLTFHRFHRNQTERLEAIVADLQTDINHLHQHNNATLIWKPLSLLNGCNTEGKPNNCASPSYLVHNRKMHIRGYVNVPASVSTILQLPKELFPLDSMKVYNQPTHLEKEDDNNNNSNLIRRVVIQSNGEVTVISMKSKGGLYLDGMSLLLPMKMNDSVEF